MKRIQWFQSTRITVVILLSILVLLFIAFGREYIGNLQVRYEINASQKEYERVALKKMETQRLIEDLSSEYFVEKEGRTKHGLALPGEKVIVVADGIEKAEETKEIRYGIDSKDAVPMPERWLYYFFVRERFDYLKSL